MNCTRTVLSLLKNNIIYPLGKNNRSVMNCTSYITRIILFCPLAKNNRSVGKELS
jgi:hypothetical protein